MALFQKSVLQKHLKTLEGNAQIEKAYTEFVAYFHNPTIQENIRKSKEEQFQAGFLRALFVKILGYTLNPAPDFNMTTELKNVKNSKKADGAILQDGKAIAVVELKGMNTPDLSKVEAQAFGYKNNQPDAVYVITSNFQKLRFYIDNAIEFIEFNLFTLTKEQFYLLWLCLAKESIFKNLPKKVNTASVMEEENVTKKLYKDYSAFKNALFNDLVLKNPVIDQLVLFKKSQKLIDRFLFIFFAEDKGLLPPNSITQIVKTYDTLKQADFEKPLYEVFQQYFGYINSGRPAKGDKAEIFAFNGGLFAPDPMLDQLIISDSILMNHTLVLSGYDFETEVDVNILGHIFEHSLNEIDEMTAQLEGQTIDKSKTKRKKDGVFYTPKYITKYIVDNTVGKLCQDKKTELQLLEVDYSKNYINTKKRTNKDGKKTNLSVEGETILEHLRSYRAYLLELTICDPACGSGAFLNQALDFLIKEHQHIDELQAQLLNVPMVLSDITNDILERNIYGVDINEESVEIARLSLWLRSAKKGRALTTLSNNIKCGNSLIDDPEVAGDKAFHWETEFPNVFKNGGFDVVIGNPPYVRIQGIKEGYPELARSYESIFLSAVGNYDLYVLFIERTSFLINTKGLVSFILPHKFLIAEFGEGIRSFLLQKKSIKSIVHFQEHLIFKDASTYTCILTLSNEESTSFKFMYAMPDTLMNNNMFFDVNFANLANGKWSINNPKIQNVLDKLFIQPKIIGDYIKVFSGIQTSGDKIYIIRSKSDQESKVIKGYSSSLDSDVEIESGLLKPLIKGDSINRFGVLDTELYVIFPYSIINDIASPMTELYIKENYPKGYQYLKKHEVSLRGREKGKMDKEGWFLYVYPKNLVTSNYKKLVSPDITLGLQLTKDNSGICVKNGAYGISLNDSKINEYTVLSILNSSLLWFFLKNTGNVLRGGYFRFNTKYINPFPVFNLENSNVSFDEKIKGILYQNMIFSELHSKFTRLLQRKFTIEKLSKKLQSWHTLTFAEFVKELKKKKIKLGLAEEAEWEDYFETEKAKALAIQSTIDQTDKEIDQMVYALYGLTEEEVRIVEER